MSGNAPGEQRLSPPDRLRRWVRLLIGLLIVAVVAAIVWSQLPRGGYPTDLGLIGQGRPALVLIYDHFYIGGGEVMRHMDGIRADYSGRVEFLVADMNKPEGRSFALQYGVRDGTVLLFASDGALRTTVNQPGSPAELRAAVSSAFEP